MNLKLMWKYRSCDSKYSTSESSPTFIEWCSLLIVHSVHSQSRLTINKVEETWTSPSVPFTLFLLDFISAICPKFVFGCCPQSWCSDTFISVCGAKCDSQSQWNVWEKTWGKLTKWKFFISNFYSRETPKLDSHFLPLSMGQCCSPCPLRLCTTCTSVMWHWISFTHNFLSLLLIAIDRRMFRAENRNYWNFCDNFFSITHLLHVSGSWGERKNTFGKSIENLLITFYMCSIP